MPQKLITKDTEQYILHILEMNTRVSVAELCERFGIAPSTARKKLAEMEARGLLIRTYGGAVSVDANRDEPISKKVLMNVAQKKAIASAAIEFIRDGDTIALGGGSTIAEMSLYLKRLRDSIIITNSIAVANNIMNNEHIEVRVNSGIVRGRTGCIVGPKSTELFAESEADVAFVSCDAFHIDEGAFNDNLLIGELEHSVLVCGKKKYVLCDSSKLNKKSIFAFMPIEAITALITDDDADPYYVGLLRDRGLEVIVAPVFRIGGGYKNEF